MKHVYYLLIALLAVLVACSSEQARKRPVRLMTYNVGAFSKELDDSAPMIARMIMELDAEIVSINELDSCNQRHDINQVQHLADELNAVAAGAKPKETWHGRFGRAIAYVGGAYGCGVVTKARIVDGFHIPLPKVTETSRGSASSSRRVTMSLHPVILIIKAMNPVWSRPAS